VDDRTLASLEHENLVAMLSDMAALADGSVRRRERGIALNATGIPVILFNQLMVTDEDADEAAFEDGVAILRERQAPFVVNLRDETDDRWVPTVQRLGLVPISEEPWMPGMAVHPLPEPRGLAVPAGLEIRRATDEAGIEGHIAAASAGFGIPEAWFRGIFDERLLDDPDVAVYTGYVDGDAALSGLGFRSGNTIGVYNIATVEAYRKRGFGGAMTARVVDDGAAAGCDVAILQSSDMGYPIYERMGFRTVVRYRGWVERGPGPE
jgi:GNAT superfamily N-acetyltransferase